MTDLRKAAEMALEALENVYGKGKRCEAAIAALRQALNDKPPVKSYCGGKPNYCTPEVTPEVTWDASAPLVLDCPRCGHCCQQREWVGLTEDEKQFFKAMGFSGIDIVEAKLKEKNT